METNVYEISKLYEGIVLPLKIAPEPSITIFCCHEWSPGHVQMPQMIPSTILVPLN